MLRRTGCKIITAMLLAAVAPAAFSTTVWLTDKQFQSRGANEFVGTIQSVQVSSASQSSESGTVQLQVNQVIAGTVTASTITFTFQRSLVPTDFLSNWDLVAPFGSSLATVVGEQLLVFVTDDAGTYSIYPANNSVQAIKQGLLVGKVVSVRIPGKDFAGHPGDPVEVKIEVSETVYGWVNGTEVTLPLSNLPRPVTGVARNGVNLDPTVSMHSSSAGSGSITFVQGGLLDDGYWGANLNKQFVLAFADGKISGIEIASDAFLTALQTLDSQ